MIAGMTKPEQIELRIHGDASRPTLIYLPGLHGDWTLVGSFRRALGDRVRFVEVTYPRTLTWSIEDYARNVENALAEKGITSGWLLGESFSSVVVWPIIERKRFKVEGLIMAGGFVRHSMRWAALLIQRVAGAMPLSLITRILFSYAKVARFRYRWSPEVMADVNTFIARRSDVLDRKAAMHRLRLVSESDPRSIARNTCVPVYAVTGLLDPIVPWIFVRHWLRRNCTTLREYKILRGDHNVLSTATDAAAEYVVKWINSSRSNSEHVGDDVRSL